MGPRQVRVAEKHFFGGGSDSANPPRTMYGLGFRAYGLGFRVEDLLFRFWGSGVSHDGLGFRRFSRSCIRRPYP